MLEIRQKTTAGFLVATAMLFIGCGFAFAKDKKDTLAFEVSADYFSKYIWRGQNLVDDGVFQSAFSVSYGSLTGTIWGSIESTNVNNSSGEITEVDYFLDYSGSLPGFEGVGYSIGLIYYDFPGSTIKDTTELYWGLALDLPLSPSITVYHDLDEAEGSYVSLGFGHSIDKIAKLSPDWAVGMEIGASLGWASGSYNKYYWGTDQSKMQDLKLTISFPIEIAGWTIAPNLNYITLLSDDIRATDVYDTASDYFFAGVSLSIDF